MTVGFHSPLPPARSGVADYSAALLTELRHRGEVQQGAARADIHLYHLGNNQLHSAIYRRALNTPGVAVLHDAVLHHFLLGTLTAEEYGDEFAYNYGEWSRALARELWTRRAHAASREEYFRYPMLRRIAERSRAVIVHNPAAAAAVRRHCPDARVFEIPHLWTPAPAAALPRGAPVFGVFGYLRETKRVAAVCRAFARVRREFPEAMLLLAGDAVSAEYARILDELACAPGVVRKPFLNSLLSEPAHVCVNLRYPSAAETSGIAIAMMGSGRCAVVTDALENSSFPSGSCVRISSGVLEEDELALMLTWLCGDRDAVRDIGDRAAAFIRREHAPERAANLYWSVLDAARD